jgi:glycerophosphoryl diester phosphodiesterase
LTRRPVPLVVGHRGSAGTSPENTIASFRAAREAKADWVEFDVRMTKDGQPVVIHDATVERTAGRQGQVALLALSELRALDAGGWFDERFRGERIPSLAEVLALLAQEPRLGANIEVKEAGGDPSAGVRTILDTVEGAFGPPAGWPGRLLVSSFDEEIVSEAARRGAPAGQLIGASARERMKGPVAARLEAAKRNGAEAAILAAARARGGAIGRARGLGLSAWVYTVNDRPLFERLAASGCDAVIGDRPADLVAWRDGPGPAAGRI